MMMSLILKINTFTKYSSHKSQVIVIVIELFKALMHYWSKRTIMDGSKMGYMVMKIV